MKHIDILRSGSRSLNLSIPEEHLRHLYQYCLELDKWNRKFNLIAKGTPIDISLEKHFLDSLTLLPIIKTSSTDNPSLLDIGTGAGFPGLALKTVCPELDITLVEPRLKRCTFLRHIIRTLELKKIVVRNCRIEELPQPTETSAFSFITSRAMTDPIQFIPLVKRFMAAESILILMQSRTEVESWLTGELKDRFQLLDQLFFTLPFSNSQRQLVLLKKTPETSPRQ